MTTTTEQVYTYAYAKKMADRVVELLEPHCEVIHIAGSIRRQKEFAKDIEIVCIPKNVFEVTDLFGGGVWKVCPEFIKVIEDIKVEIVKGNFGGRYMQVILKGGIKLDLFMPEKDDYYRQLVVRTGPAEFSAKEIAARWSSLGWAGTDKGLRRKSDCSARRNGEGKIVSWIIVNQDGEKPPPWPSEESFFEWLGIRYVEPRYR